MMESRICLIEEEEGCIIFVGFKKKYFEINIFRGEISDDLYQKF